MNEKEFKEVIELGKKIGIYTMADLKVFISTQQRIGETTLEALKRYIAELGEDFEVKND